MVCGGPGRRGVPRLLLALGLVFLLGALLWRLEGVGAEKAEGDGEGEVVESAEEKEQEKGEEAVEEGMDMGEEDDESMDLDDSEDDHEDAKKEEEKPIRIESVNLDAMTEEEAAAMKKEAEPHEFQAEVFRLMDIIINSLYTHKEVFLRELISNAADALEKTRFLSIEDDSILGDTKELRIIVEYDSDAKTLTIADTGVGMTKQDLINNLGTVAKSGTSNFLEAIAHGGDVNLIGQFGVGFYSAFLVADKVTVTSKHNDDPDQHIWESTADASFTVVKDPRGNTLGRGTRISLHLKEDSTEYLRRSHVTDLLKKYSQFVNFPIYLRVEKTISEEVPLEEEESEEKAKEEKDEEDEVKVEEEEEKPDETKPKTKKVEKTVHELKRVNVQKPIWMRPKEEITDEEYTTFYRSLVKDDSAQTPLTHIHFAAEGEIEFRAILFVPPRISRDPYEQYFNKKHDIRLYVRRVLVSEQFEDIIPNWLAFMKGVIDSDDLPLKVDRESVSQLKVIKVISKRVTRKVLDVLRKISSDSDQAADDLKTIEEKAREERRVISDDKGVESVEYSEEEKAKRTELQTTEKKYEQFWRQFGKNVKLGCVDDDGGNRSKIAKLLRYHTSKSSKEPIGLQRVLDRMGESQSSIYYLTGESQERMLESPLIQGFLKKDIEVLLLSDAVDEACISSLQDFEGKKFVSIEKGDVVLDQSDEDKEYFKKLTEYYKPLTTWWKKHMSKSAKFSRVQLSHRLVDDPVGVVASQYGTTAFGEKIVRYQTFVDPSTMLAGRINRILEINPQHPIVREMRKLHQEDEESEVLKTLADDLAETAMLASGFAVENPVSIANKLYKSFASQVKVDFDAKPEPIDLSDFEVKEGADLEGDKSKEDFDELSSFLQHADLEKMNEGAQGDKGESDDDEPPETPVKDEL